MHRGVATFTLDYGTCPPWLFERMVRLGRELMRVMAEEYGPDEFVKRIADPVWFQSLGTVLAFDWNASGLTTILTAALKEAIRGREREFGLFICGGKGRTSRKTPDEILRWGNEISFSQEQTNSLIYSSRMAAKVDSSLVQDGFQIYHHAFFFSKNGHWAVVQQGMNKEAKSARRYHWYSDKVEDFVRDPHAAIISDPLLLDRATLNLTAGEGEQNRSISLDLARAGYDTVIKDIKLLRRHESDLSRMISFRFSTQAEKNGQLTLLELAHKEFKTHQVVLEDFTRSRYLAKILQRIAQKPPQSYESFVALRGVGPKTVRALALVSEVLYGAPLSYRDPARYSFAHGGKDATPYPVDKQTYDKTIQFFSHVVGKMKMLSKEKTDITSSLKHLASR